MQEGRALVVLKRLGTRLCLSLAIPRESSHRRLGATPRFLLCLAECHHGGVDDDILANLQLALSTSLVAAAATTEAAEAEKIQACSFGMTTMHIGSMVPLPTQKAKSPVSQRAKQPASGL